MIIQKIKLKNFQCYEKFETTFSSMNLVKGKNGSGKTTLGLDAILFVIYGYSKKNLVDVPMRNKSKSCTVEATVEHQGKIYEIKRSYPTKLSVTVDGEEQKFVTSAETQRFLNSIFGDAKAFQKFRTIDSSVGINFLEEGQQALKKTLFSTSDEIFNNVRDRLNKIKHEREIYNKDKAVVYTHFPSEKRYNILKEAKVKLDQIEDDAMGEIRKLEEQRISIERKVSDVEGKVKYFKTQMDKTKNQGECYVCHRGLTDEQKTDIIKNLEEKVQTLSLDAEDYNAEKKDRIEIINSKRESREKISSKLQTLFDRLRKLEARMKQKAYKYTQADIEIVKRALLELDKLSTRYLTQSIGVLEPIINAVLEKINFKINFEVNDKGKFAIILTKDDVKYNYKDLSCGQKLILQVAFKLALLLEQNKEGILIADEGLGSLDQENLLHILSIFENYPFQLIVVLHRFDEIPGEFKIINLDKED